MPTLTWNDARARRLARSFLARPATRARLVRVVRDVCGLQAQLLTAAALSLSARIPLLTTDAFARELWETRSLVRAWTVRGTIHVVPAEDLPLWMGALGEDRYWESKEWLEREGLTAREAETVYDTVIDVLGDSVLTRAEIADAVVARLGARLRPKIASMWGNLLGPVTYMGKLCFGPPSGPNVTFVRADRWIPWRTVDPVEAWRELMRRFLRAYGPAPIDGVARWFGIDPPLALRVLRSLGGEAISVSVEGREAWILQSDLRRPPAAPPSVTLLPQYDCYVLGSYPRERVVNEAARTRIRQYKRGRFEGAVGVPVLLLDGIVSGLWERRVRRGRMEVTVEASTALSRTQRRGIQAEAERVGHFFGRAVDLSIR
jgi:hypothetical protein